MIRSSLCLIALLMLSQSVAAEESGEARSRVRIKAPMIADTDPSVTQHLKNGWIKGDLVAIDEEAIHLQVADVGGVRVPRGWVQDMEISAGRSRTKGALWGLGIGLTAGVIVAGIESSRCDHSGFDLCGLEWALPFLTTPAGGAIGLAIGKERWMKTALGDLELRVVPVVGRGAAVGISLTW